MPISNLTNILRKNIVKIGNLFAVKARSKASSANVPAVPNAIEVGTPLPFGKMGTRIEIKVNQQKMKGKDGRDISGAEWAYEEGSGLYGPKGAKYPIVPKKKSVLAFPGSRSFLLERSQTLVRHHILLLLNPILKSQLFLYCFLIRSHLL